MQGIPVEEFKHLFAHQDVVKKRPVHCMENQR
jgi:hypothetical protein